MTKYVCPKCGKELKNKTFKKTYKKLVNGKIVKVPICCDMKMSIIKE